MARNVIGGPWGCFSTNCFAGTSHHFLVTYRDTPFYSESLLGTYSKIMKHTPDMLTFPDSADISDAAKVGTCLSLSLHSISNVLKAHQC